MKADGSLPVAAIFGAAGFIGKNLRLRFSKNNLQTVGITRNFAQGFLTLDLLKPDIGPLESELQGVTHAIIAAVESKIASCETDPVSTREVNVLGTAELARQLCSRGIKVIAFSSDTVFDGTIGNYEETAPVSPINEYGRQKAEMEKLLLKTCGKDILILRLSKVFDMVKGSRTLLDEMAGMLTRGETVFAARDQFFCPIWVGDVADVISRLMATDASGVMHLCTPQKISRFELARNIAETFGVDPKLVQSISLRDLGENFSRPLDTSMVCHRLGRYVKHNFKDLHECIKELAFNYQGNIRDEKV